MDRRTELRDFLRSRRARVSPSAAGLRAYGSRRRVPGLRREELAQLAGVSVDYYVRLEQGRGGKVSAEILDSVATALRLDEIERQHLHALVHSSGGPRSAAESPHTAGAGLGSVHGRREQQVRPGLQRVLDTLEHSPAYVVGRRLQILAWNHLARVLIADFPRMPEEDRNLARLTFLDTTARRRYVDWQKKADDTVAFLRVDVGRHPYDAELTALIAELSATSEDFRRMWADHTVRDETHGAKPLHHPRVGALDLTFETFRIPDDPDQALTVYTAEPGSPAAAALKRLAEEERPEEWQ
ncbi:helix-turn-helix transcriptional regulator [Streptomyces sp. FIT100]|uniref:helix-turn-helix transcriptional regulator n=1 Tax=Streptomyces sp. FIT100 TaxID=2837956 RepID=UPI0021C8D4CE|nr:helix-turn-helix transcriptional regulator [Streptomyces sp. FIT100]UUN26748.1 helix-turn-helix domain-containing protein [Streptomyces sp. FIT100]